MNHKIICYTLFDITNTGVPNRARHAEDEDHDTWLLARNQQCNFDTILQVISLRSQPEVITSPQKLLLATADSIFFKDNFFGFVYDQLIEQEISPCWMFVFEVQHSSVFEDGISPLGALYEDCDNIPMIKCGTEWDKISNFLDTTPELRNICFSRVDQ